MKELLLMRHAKSAVGNAQTEDINRVLNDRGLRDAAEMGKRIHKLNFTPDVIICSIAKRTTETAKIVAKQLKYDEQAILRETLLYQADIEDMIHLIRNLDESVKKVLIIGHNPTFTGAVGYIGDKFIDHLPTSGIALLKMNIKSWKQTAMHSATTVHFDFPKSAENK